MADYFPVLSRAVAGLPNNTAEARRAVYDRARAAIIRQLRAIEPPLPEEDIARERMGLEEAIRKIEANAGGAPAAQPAAPKPAAPATSSSPVQPAPVAKTATPVGAGSGPEAKPQGAPQPAGQAGAPKPGAPRRDLQAAPPAGRGGPAQARPATRPDGRPIVRTAPGGVAEPERKRSAPLIALGALALIAVAAGLFAARGQIAALFGGSGSEVAQTTPAATPETKPAEQPPAPTEQAAKTDGKSDDRAPQQDAPPAGQDTVQTPPPEQDVARAPDATAPAPTAPAPAPAEPAQPAQPPAEQPASPGALVAQRAVLYEEGPNQQSGEALNGTVLWRTESVSGGQGQPLETAVRGDIEIPGRKLGATLTIRRNVDATLPASHTIEIQFKLPENFPNAGVSNVPGLLMKADEAARGAAVAGLSVRVMNGFFLIGLSNLDTEKSVNEQLLRDRGWIDLPILYDNGRRAVLTLEKGTPGTQSFNEAFTAWRSAAASAQGAR